jgi:hypothetical protein
MTDWRRAGGGGSAAHIVRRGDLALKQGVDAAGRAKIDDERRWLQWIAATADPDLRACFVGVDPRHCAPGVLAMPWVDGANARSLALASVIDHDVVRRAVHQGAVALFRTGREAPDDSVWRWWADQLGRRADLAHQRRRTVPGVFRARHVRLAGGMVPNPLLGGLGPVTDLLRRHPPTAVGPIHGDLHLGNLIVTPDRRGIWVDPRGRFGRGRAFDLAYDVAKLLHEPHYVAARARAMRTRLAIVGDEVVATTVRAPSDDDRRVVGPLAETSRTLAGSVCRALGTDDPLLAARATLYVGLLFVTVLPFAVLVDSEWETMLLSGFLWLTAGLTALRQGWGLALCETVWSDLLGDVEHHAAAPAAHMALLIIPQ